MIIQKSKRPYTDLYDIEKFIFNSFFSIIIVYILTIGYYKDFLVTREINGSAIVVLYVLIFVLFLSWFFSHLNKTELTIHDETAWSFFKGNKKHCFETNKISYVKKSFWGIYSSFLIVADHQKIRIPAESENLTQLIRNLSHRLTKEQISDFLLYCQRASLIRFEMEKVASFLKKFCFFIAPIAFFTATKIWECSNKPICITWSVLSIFSLIIWTFGNYFLLRIFVKFPAVFSRISTIWGFFGVMLYMLQGIWYRSLYLKMIYEV